MKIYGYCRVSTDRQDLSKYIEQLKNIGIDEDDIFKDIITGTKREREGLNKLLEIVKEGDTIVIPDMTRLGRSTIDLLNIVEELKEKSWYKVYKGYLVRYNKRQSSINFNAYYV